jgi:hypothetical protein
MSAGDDDPLAASLGRALTSTRAQHS